jgi:hypothetical protein
MNAHPEDICYCGDFRKDHKDGTGRCIFNDEVRDGHGGAGPCYQFRLAQAVSLTQREKTP